MKFLAIDTSGSYMSVIVENDGKVSKSFYKDCTAQHSVILMEEVEKLLNKEELKISDLDFIACVVGAGSFTGIRIGISTVKALCFAGSIKCLPVTSFDTIAYNKGKGKVLAVINAGHGGYYVCGYTENNVSLSPRYILKEELLSLKKEYDFLSTEKIDGIKSKIVSPIDGLYNAVVSKVDKLDTPNNLEPLYVRKSQAEEGRP